MTVRIVLLIAAIIKAVVPQDSISTGLARQNWYLPLGETSSFHILRTNDDDFATLINPTSIGLLHVPDLGYRFKNNIQKGESILCAQTIHHYLITISSFQNQLYYGLWESTRGSSLQRLPLEAEIRDEVDGGTCQIYPHELPDNDFQVILLINSKYMVLADYEKIHWARLLTHGYDTISWSLDQFFGLSAKKKRLNQDNISARNGTILKNIAYSLSAECISSTLTVIGNSTMPWALVADESNIIHAIRLQDGLHTSINAITPTFAPENIRNISRIGNGSVLEALIHTESIDYSLELYDAPSEELSASVIMLPNLNREKFQVDFPDQYQLDKIYGLFRLIQDEKNMFVELIALEDGSILYTWQLQPMFPSKIHYSFVQVVDIDDTTVYWRLVGVDADGAVVSYDNLPTQSPAKPNSKEPTETFKSSEELSAESNEDL